MDVKNLIHEAKFDTGVSKKNGNAFNRVTISFLTTDNRYIDKPVFLWDNEVEKLGIEKVA